MTIVGKPDIAELVRKNRPRSLVKALGHDGPQVRAAAARGLADLGEMHALHPLARAVENDSDPQARDAACAALQRLLDELERKGPHGEHSPWQESKETFRSVLAVSGWNAPSGSV